MGGLGASQSFSRLYIIPGAYHCLFAPDGTSVNLADFLTPIISWVEDGVAPGEVEADTSPSPCRRSRSSRRCSHTTP
jgi:Tannase and feruloyl esterase